MCEVIWSRLTTCTLQFAHAHCCGESALRSQSCINTQDVARELLCDLFFGNGGEENTHTRLRLFVLLRPMCLSQTWSYGYVLATDMNRYKDVFLGIWQRQVMSW